MKIKWIILTVLVSLIFCFPVRADMGPKPEINITIKNPPLEDYYLDLLIEGSVDDNYYNNLRNGQEIYEESLVDLLRKSRLDGWHLGIVDGTGIPMSGKLIGVQKNGKIIHHFGYVGVPDAFKVIVVTKSGEVKISEVFHRHSFITNLTYDFEYNIVKEQIPLAVSYLIQFATTCIPTLLVEGILLIAFGFSKKKNWLVFLTVNLITQILLTATMGSALIKSGLLMAMIVQFIMETLILAGETIAYTFLLEGHGKGRRIGYGLTANVCTWVMGFFIIVAQSLVMGNLT